MCRAGALSEQRAELSQSAQASAWRLRAESILQINIGTGILIGLLMIIGGLVDRLFLKPNLRLVRYEAPGYYFVRGFSSTFLARLAEFAEKSNVAQFPINRFPEMPFIERPGK